MYGSTQLRIQLNCHHELRGHDPNCKKSKGRTNDFPKKKASKNSEETLKKQTVAF